MQYNDLLLTALSAASQAGEEILKIYNSDMDFSVEAKADSSPLTIADKKSHEIICAILDNTVIESNSSPVPILSEEGKTIPYEERSKWDMFWMIDPLDGTKEFIKRNDEFTVNIALINQNRPVLGVVYVPVPGVCYFAAEGLGAFMTVRSETVKGEEKKDKTKWLLRALSEMDLQELLSKSKRLPIINNNPSLLTSHSSPYIIIASRSHMNKETEDFIEKLKAEHGEIELLSAGSSLKLCYVAEGRAHIYPRLGPTMEWDTAAAHAVVRGAGKTVKVFDSEAELSYNKENLLNPWFVVE